MICFECLFDDFGVSNGWKIKFGGRSTCGIMNNGHEGMTEILLVSRKDSLASSTRCSFFLACVTKLPLHLCCPLIP